jgi:hypothetical protein
MRKNSAHGLFPFIESPGTGKTLSAISYLEEVPEGWRAEDAGRASGFINLQSCVYLGSVCFCYMTYINNKLYYFKYEKSPAYSKQNASDACPRS